MCRSRAPSLLSCAPSPGPGSCCARPALCSPFLFTHSAFPPKYALPVSLLPQQCRDFLHSPAVSAASSSSFSHSSPAAASLLPGCPSLVPLLRASYQASSDCLQLSIHDYFFFSLALFLTRDLPAAGKLLLSLPQTVPSAANSTVGLHNAAAYHFNLDDCYRSYQSVVQQYLALFMPSTAASSATAGGVSGANRALHAASLSAILAEVWMGEAASHYSSSLSLSSLHSDSSAGDGLSSSPSLPSPFVSSGSPSSSSSSSASPLSRSASSLSSADRSAAASFSFPSLRVLGCVRLLVAHLLSAPSSTAPATALKHSSSAATSFPSAVSSTLSSSSSSSISSAAVWALSVSSVDVCLFRFLRSCLLHPPSQYDDRLLSLVAVWLSVLTAAVSPPPSSSSPPVVHASLAFFSVLLVDYLHCLLALDVGREGSAMRTACLRQCVQLMGLLHSCRAELERVEQLLLFAGMDVARKGAGRLGRQPPPYLTRAPVGSRSSAAQQETALIRAHFVRLAAQLPDEQSVQRVFTRPSGVQQLIVQVVRYLTPASIRQGLAPLSLSTAAAASQPVSASRSSAQLVQSSSAFRSQLIAEAQHFDRFTQLAAATFDLPADAIDESHSEHDSNGAQAAWQAAAAAVGSDSSKEQPLPDSAVRSLSPSRLRSDPYQRLSSTGRQQLARGVALCSKQSASLRFVGGEWDRPIASNECAAAVRLLHKLHVTLTAATATQHDEQQQLAHVAMLAQLPLRMFARWDVLAGGLSVLLLIVTLLVILVII